MGPLPRATWLLALSIVSGCGLLLEAGGDDAPPERDGGTDATSLDAAVDAVAADAIAALDAGALDAEPLDSGALDAGEGPAPFCTSFTTPVRADEIGSPFDEWGPTLSPDGLTLYFSSDRRGNRDIYMARRPARGSPFGPPLPVEALNSAAVEDDPSISHDGLALCFTSQRGPSGLWVSQRSDVSAPWGAPVPFGIEGMWGGCELTIEPNEVFFTVYSMMPTLHWSRRSSAGDPWQAPMSLALSPEGDFEGYAGISPDGLTALFIGPGPGTTPDIWYATRPALGTAFTPVAQVPALSSTRYDTDPEPSWDGTEVWLASNRDGTNFEIYVSQVVCP